MKSAMFQSFYTSAIAPSLGYFSNSLHQLSKLREYLVSAFVAQSDIKVWKSQDSSGQIQWHIYDRHSQKQYNFQSEVEACSWIENHH